eukprot:evm.model.NODE_29167_length_7231_cov_18.064030.1
MATTNSAPPAPPHGAAPVPPKSSGFPSNHPRVEQVYDLGRVLGKGSFSTVYLGVQKITGEEVALKVIPAKNYRHNERAKQLLRTEVAVMSRIRKLHHPNLMNFKHTFEDAEKIVMVLEILSGGELFDRIVKKGHYSERDASLLTGVIVRALGALHSVGILHRDLKPENCIYSTASEDSPLKITDFGLAALVSSPTEKLVDRHLVGTPGYICPAVLTGYEYSAASDIWAAGVILFILLSGSPPFYGRTHKEIFEKIKTAHWGFHGRNWGQVSEGAKDLVKRMLRQKPADRFTVEEVLDHPWIREHEQVSAEDLPGTLESLKLFSAKQKFRAAVMVCIGSARMQRVKLAAAAAAAAAGKGAEEGREERKQEEEFLQGLFSEEELERLKAEFGRVAAENAMTSPSTLEGKVGGKVLNFGQFREIMTGLGLDHLPLERIFKVFDSNGTGDVDYREFLVGLSDKIPGPYANKEAARAANNGAYPPDLSLITKARGGGVDYIFALLTGYIDPPEGKAILSGLNYNPYFPGGAIAMARQLQDGQLEYEDGTPATTSQMSKDVAVFLAWAAEPEHDYRKKAGVQWIGALLAALALTGFYKRFRWSTLKTAKFHYVA